MELLTDRYCDMTPEIRNGEVEVDVHCEVAVC
jgi:hypothetical protein